MHSSQLIRGTGWHHRLQHIRESIKMALKTQVQKQTYAQCLTHTNLPQWYWGQQLLVLLRSTARISPCEHVGIGSMHDSHTAHTETHTTRSVFCCNWWRCNRWRGSRRPTTHQRLRNRVLCLTYELLKAYHIGKSSSRFFPPWPPLGTDLPCSVGQTQEGMPWGHTLRKTSHSKAISEGHIQKKRG